VHAPAGSGSCDWSRALLDSKINYVTWDGTKWQAKVNGSTFTHAPQSDLRRTHTSDHLNYKFPDGTKWSMKATNPG
jgi:hypothetical protein